MVVDSTELFVIREAGRDCDLEHIYVDEESAKLALINYFTATKIQTGEIWIETIQAKKMQHCCEM